MCYHFEHGIQFRDIPVYIPPACAAGVLCAARQDGKKHHTRPGKPVFLLLGRKLIARHPSRLGRDQLSERAAHCKDAQLVDRLQAVAGPRSSP